MYKIITREFARIFSRVSTKNLLLFIPIFTFFYLGAIYWQGALRDIPVAIYDLDHSNLSKTITKYIDASAGTKIVKSLNSADNIEKIFLKYPEIKAVYFIPSGTEKSVVRGKSAKVLVYTNSSNIVYGNILYKDAMTVIGTINAGILLKKFKIMGLTHEKAMGLIQPIRVKYNPLYNSYYNYLYYLLPGLVTVLVQMIFFFVATRSINSEKNEGTFDNLLSVAKNNIFKIIIGKSIAYLIMGLVITLFILGVIFPFFGIPFYNTLNLIWFFLIFIAVNIFLGMALSVIIDDEAFAMDVAFVYNSPAFVFSGFTFPIFAMPSFDQFYAQLIPYTHFLYGFFKLYQMNLPVKYVTENILNLLIFLIVGMIVTFVAFYIRVKKYKKNG